MSRIAYALGCIIFGYYARTSSTKGVRYHDAFDHNQKPSVPRAHNYAWAANVLRTLFDISDIKLVFEVGSRDLMDGNFIAHFFNATVFSFEANPENVKVMKENNADPRVNIVESAVSRLNGMIQFYPYNLSLYDNRGGGSVFMTDFVTNRNVGDADYNRTSVQYEVNVTSTRLDTFVDKLSLRPPTGAYDKRYIPDMLCLDVQESEEDVLRSAGSYLKQMKHVVVEASAKPQYKSDFRNFDRIHEYMVSMGFNLTASKAGRHVMLRTIPKEKSGDFLYSNSFGKGTVKMTP